MTNYNCNCKKISLHSMNSFFNIENECREREREINIVITYNERFNNFNFEDSKINNNNKSKKKITSKMNENNP